MQTAPAPQQKVRRCQQGRAGRQWHWGWRTTPPRTQCTGRPQRLGQCSQGGRARRPPPPLPQPGHWPSQGGRQCTQRWSAQLQRHRCQGGRLGNLPWMLPPLHSSSAPGGRRRTWWRGGPLHSCQWGTLNTRGCQWRQTGCLARRAGRRRPRSPPQPSPPWCPWGSSWRKRSALGWLHRSQARRARTCLPALPQKLQRQCQGGTLCSWRPLGWESSALQGSARSWCGRWSQAGESRTLPRTADKRSAGSARAAH